MPRDPTEDASDLIVPPDEPAPLDAGFRRTLLERLVARALPPASHGPRRGVCCRGSRREGHPTGRQDRGHSEARPARPLWDAVLLCDGQLSGHCPGTQASRITALKADPAKVGEANTGLQQQLAQAIKQQTILRGEAAAFHNLVDA
jgi:hypothetical protein